ncbi:type II secretion system minor pseudopilin GspJ [Vibrio hannami]|uniref:type II secretion system minor pseudopilin GspJ n=1 Tax=Vibrio hannami TaxID=2717094 RepID=UPI0024100CE5|nr:type II secretion system minor pseudopilin GspJ [Vibrio hannami]MDG3086858.1 type II secretion system minor pseudopilin GspJ [Vibrio hannami]
MQLSNKHRSAPCSNKSAGFTLIEVLVAIAIFTMLSFSAYQVLDQTQQSNQQSIDKTQRIKELQRAMVTIDNDFRQMALRQFRHNGEEASSRLIWWGNGLLESESNGVLFTRLGWQNPQQMFPRGEVTKVGYRVKENRLERVWWRFPDTPSGQEGIVTPLLSGVKKIGMRFLGSDGWKTSWEEAYSLPKAVEFTLTLEDYGDISRVYLTTGGKLDVADNQEEDE